MLLHLVERFRKGPFQLQGFLDFIAAHVRIFPILEKARTLMLVKELGDRGYVCLPVLRKSFEVCKNSRDARLGEEHDRVVNIFVKIGVENALIHEMQPRADIEKDPAKIVELERRKDKRIGLHGGL